LLPWLAILGLLLLKPNRNASAWWIWVPLGCVAWVASGPQLILGFLPSSQYELFLELIGALGFGLAATWLLSSYLGWKHRMLTFLGILLAMEGFSVLSFVARQDWQGVGFETLAAMISLMVGGLVISIALSLAGLACRRRFGWLRLSVWSLAAVVVVWSLIYGPFFLISIIANGGRVPLLTLFGIAGVVSGVTFGTLLPFLVLSFVNRFYRERLKALLHLGGTASPPVITPPMPAVAAAVGS